MSTEDTTKAAEAAIAVMNALQPLNAGERSRVLHSAAALFAVNLNVAPANVGQGSGGSSQLDVGTPGDAGLSRNAGKRRSLVEFLIEKEPATNDQRIACFAYYREKFEGVQNFSGKDLAAYFSQAKLPAPGSNFARDYKKAVKKAWIHDEGANSYLTQAGEQVVEAGFGGKGNPRRSPTKRKSSKL